MSDQNWVHLLFCELVITNVLWLASTQSTLLFLRQSIFCSLSVSTYVTRTHLSHCLSLSYTHLALYRSLDTFP